MAKKSRRARLSPTQRYMPAPGAAAPEAPDAPVARPAPAVRSPAPASRQQIVSRLGQNPEDYTHIKSDLRRIGILASSILAVLLALRVLIFR